MKLYTFCILILIFTMAATGQQFPVRASLSVLPPYSVKLSDYIDGNAAKVTATLLLNDPDIQQMEVRLRLTLLGDGITIRTDEAYRPAPIRIQGGVPELLDAIDMAALFNPANLDFQGFDKAQYLQTKRLPEGVYRFTLEVIEYRRNVLVSNAAASIAWLILNDPPRWQIPDANSTVQATFPQNMLFNWLPMHTGSPNSAFSVSYEFTMVEIYPADRNPNDAINTQVPFYQTSTASTSLILGPAEPAMVPGRRYAVRLRAIDTDNRDLFKNNGYSEVLAFQFGNECLPPTQLSPSSSGYDAAYVSWTPAQGNTDFTITYRQLGLSNAQWYSTTSLMNRAEIRGLAEGKQYEYYLSASCQGGLTSVASVLDTITIPTRPVNAFVCDPSAQGTPATRANALRLVQGQTVTVLGCVLKIVELRESNGLYSGSGEILIPFLQNAKLGAEFKDLSIDAATLRPSRGNIQMARNALNAVLSQAQQRGQQAMTDIRNAAGSAIADSRQLITTAGQNLGNLGSNLSGMNASTIGSNLGGLVGGGSGGQSGGGSLGNVAGAVQGAASNLGGGLGAAGTAAANALGSDINKLKEIFEKVLKAKRDTVRADSASSKARLIKANSDFETLKKELEGELYEPSTDNEFEDQTESAHEESIVESVSPEASSSEVKIPLVTELNTASNQKSKAEIDWKKIDRSLKWLLNFSPSNATNINQLLESFKNDAVDFLKGYVMNNLSGTQKENLERKVKEFVNKKISDAISAPN